MVSLSDGRVRFVQIHPASRTELLAVGDAAFARDDASGDFVPAPTAYASFVHGHDVPRMAWAETVFADSRSEEGSGRPARLERPIPEALGSGSVTIELGDWRPVIGFSLPFAVTFLQAGERHDYRYTHVLPFRLAPGSSLPAEPTALFARLGDLGELVAAHERGLAAHRASDAEALVANQAPEGTVSGRGVLSTSTRAGMLERMRGYLGSIRFTRYVDTAVPVVAVSADGTLGWLACQIDAAGERTVDGRTEPLAYAFSWVELYARAPDLAAPWLAIGNASSPKP
jgi:hypothetical protein